MIMQYLHFFKKGLKTKKNFFIFYYCNNITAVYKIFIIVTLLEI